LGVERTSSDAALRSSLPEAFPWGGDPHVLTGDHLLDFRTAGGGDDHLEFWGHRCKRDEVVNHLLQIARVNFFRAGRVHQQKTGVSPDARPGAVSEQGDRGDNLQP
jgi:hypothetical protein